MKDLEIEQLPERHPARALLRAIAALVGFLGRVSVIVERNGVGPPASVPPGPAA
jgi:hypothetical protein